MMDEGDIVLPGNREVAEEMTGLRACVFGKVCPSVPHQMRECVAVSLKRQGEKKMQGDAGYRS